MSALASSRFFSSFNLTNFTRKSNKSFFQFTGKETFNPSVFHLQISKSIDSPVKSFNSKSDSRFFQLKKIMASSEVSSTAEQSIEVEDEVSFWKRISTQQKSVPKLSPVEESRTVMQEMSRGFLSTISKKFDDHPFGSMVGFASDDDGNIILSISSLSPHTTDLENNPKCSFLFSRNPMDQGESIITVVGNAIKVPDDEVSIARKFFLERHPDAFWVDFGDFHFVKIHPIKVRYVANVASFSVGASVAEFSAAEFKEAKADPISKFSFPISKHMNEDHEDAIVAMVNNSLDVKVSSAKIITVDRFGMTIQAKLKDRESKIRVGFSKPAENRKDVKDLIVQLTREAKASA